MEGQTEEKPGSHETEDTRNRILFAAQKLFGEKGFDSTSVRDITTEAGCNVASVNYHFGGLDPFGYRIAHIFVHLLSAMLLWVIVARTLRLDYFQGRFDRVAEPLSFAAALVGSTFRAFLA